MIREEEIEELKKHLDANGKLIISDDLPDAKKERYQFINSLNIDIIEVLSRKKEDYSLEENVEEEVEENSEEDFDEVEVESFDDENVTVTGSSSTSPAFTENEDVSVDDLNELF